MTSSPLATRHSPLASRPSLPRPNRLRLHRQLHQQVLERVIVRIGAQRRLSLLQLFDATLEREAFLVQRREPRIVRSRGGRVCTTAKEDTTRERAITSGGHLHLRLRRSLLVAVVVELRMLRLQPALVVVVALRLRHRITKRLEERDASVLVDVGAVARERGDEVLREYRLVPLEAALRRRDHAPIRRREQRQHVPARARQIDERDLLRAERTEVAREIARRHIWARKADLRVLLGAASVSNEHDHCLVARAGSLRESR